MQGRSKERNLETTSPQTTREQISNGDLKNLLEELHYDLTTMVIHHSIPVTFSI